MSEIKIKDIVTCTDDCPNNNGCIGNQSECSFCRGYQKGSFDMKNSMIDEIVEWAERQTSFKETVNYVIKNLLEDIRGEQNE